MKKLFFVFASFVAICMASSCDKTTNGNTTTDTDSVAVDSLDTIATDTIDSVAADTAVVDTVAELAQN